MGSQDIILNRILNAKMHFEETKLTEPTEVVLGLVEIVQLKIAIERHITLSKVYGTVANPYIIIFGLTVRVDPTTFNYLEVS